MLTKYNKSTLLSSRNTCRSGEYAAVLAQSRLLPWHWRGCGNRPEAR